MPVIIVYIFFLVSFILVLQLKWKFIFFLPVFNLIADMSFTFFPGFSVPTVFRAFIIFVFLFFSTKGISKLKIFKNFLLFFGLIIIMLMFSSEFIYSLRAVVQIVFSMTMYMVGYLIFSKKNGLEDILNNLVFVIFFGIAATAVGYLFNVGKELEYTTSPSYQNEIENVGLLGSGGMFVPGMALGLMPLILKFQKGKVFRFVLILSSSLLFLLILLNMRRTAIVVPLIGLSVFFIYSPIKKKFKSVRYIFISITVLILLFPLYSSILIKRYEVRKEQGRFNKEFIKTENRYKEYIDMSESIFSFNEPLKIMVGYGNNLFADQYENGKAVRRMIHSDIPKIYYSLGIIGLIFYINIYLAILKKIASIPAQGFLRILKASSMGLFLISVLVSLNGSITLFSFRTVSFLLLGVFIGHAQKLTMQLGKLPAH